MLLVESLNRPKQIICSFIRLAISHHNQIWADHHNNRLLLKNDIIKYSHIL